jgi:ribosomal protein S27AE
MSSACPKCGVTEATPMRHWVTYELAWALGDLRQCPSCRKLRLIRRHDDRFHDSLKSRMEAAAVARFGEEGGR